LKNTEAPKISSKLCEIRTGVRWAYPFSRRAAV
jgi:hypothetical protein